MTALAILTSALQAIPGPIRQGILVVFALAVVGVGIAEIWVSVPGEVYKTLVYVGGYLGVQSAANVHADGTVEVVE